MNIEQDRRNLVKDLMLLPSWKILRMYSLEAKDAFQDYDIDKDTLTESLHSYYDFYFDELQKVLFDDASFSDNIDISLNRKQTYGDNEVVNYIFDVETTIKNLECSLDITKDDDSVFAKKDTNVDVVFSFSTKDIWQNEKLNSLSKILLNCRISLKNKKGETYNLKNYNLLLDFLKRSDSTLVKETMKKIYNIIKKFNDEKQEKNYKLFFLQDLVEYIIF